MIQELDTQTYDQLNKSGPMMVEFYCVLSASMPKPKKF